MSKNEIPLRCTCGAVTGTATLRHQGMRLVCMCRGCQAYARFLGREEDMLDSHGGTDVYQLTQSEVRITSGQDQIRAVRQTPKGAVRWYSECCKTPLGNTLDSARWAFVGIPSLFMDHEADGRSRDEAIGPVLYKIHARHAKNPPVPGGHPKGPLSLVLRAIFQIGGNTLLGRSQPSPYFDPKGQPTAPFRLLTGEERVAIGLRA